MVAAGALLALVLLPDDELAELPLLPVDVLAELPLSPQAARANSKTTILTSINQVKERGRRTNVLAT